MALGIQKNSLDLKNQAATKIQSKFRGHFARLKIDALKRQEFKCPIKQDWINYDNSTLTKCHHIFDTHSLSQWIDQVTVSKLSIDCPSCRHNISSLNTELLRFARDGKAEDIQNVVRQGANVNTTIKDGWTALQIAALKGKTEIVQALIDLGAKLEAKDKREVTALHRAAQSGQAKTIQALIERGAKLEAKDKDGWTALHVATYYGHTKAVETLIDLGANGGLRALHIAIANGHTKTVQTLIKSVALYSIHCIYCIYLFFTSLLSSILSKFLPEDSRSSRIP